MDIVGPTWADSHCVSHFLSLDAYESAKMLCDQYYLTSPEVEIKQVNCEQEFFSLKLSVFVCPVHSESWTVRKPELCSGSSL